MPDVLELEEMLDVDDSGWANLIAIDPGGTTGWSVMMVHPDALAVDDVSILANIEHWSHGQLYGDADSQVKQTYRKDRDLLSPVVISAKLEFGLKFWPGLGGQRSRIPMFKQPTSVLASITDDRLREWGFYDAEGGMEHARDADRHALYFFRGCKTGVRARDIRLRAWPELFGRD
jgi:hypothetical protein